MNNKEEQHSRCFVPNHEDNKKNCLAIRRQLRRTILILVDANSDQTWANPTFDPKENRQGVTDPTASPKIQIRRFQKEEWQARLLFMTFHIPYGNLI